MSELNAAVDAIPVKESSRRTKAFLKTAKHFKNLMFSNDMLSGMLSNVATTSIREACGVFRAFGEQCQKVTETFIKEYNKLEEKNISLNREERDKIIAFIQSSNQLTDEQKSDKLIEFQKFYLSEKKEIQMHRLEVAKQVANKTLEVAGIVITIVSLGKDVNGSVKTISNNHTKLKTTKLKMDTSIAKTQIRADTAAKILGKNK